MEKAYNININTLPQKGFMAILETDKKLVGTDGYLGFAYFWAYEYRHYLRDQKPHILRKVHSTFLANKLPLTSESIQHLNIIKRITKLN